MWHQDWVSGGYTSDDMTSNHESMYEEAIHRSAFFASLDWRWSSTARAGSLPVTPPCEDKSKCEGPYGQVRREPPQHQPTPTKFRRVEAVADGVVPWDAVELCVPWLLEIGGGGGSTRTTHKEGQKPEKSSVEEKPSRGRPWAYKGMMEEKGDPVALWRRAVAQTWIAVDPDNIRAQLLIQQVTILDAGGKVDGDIVVLDIDNKDDRRIIVGIVEHLCKVQDLKRFKVDKLHSALESTKMLFADDNFLSLHLTTTTGKYMSVESGLLAVLVVALGVQRYTDIVNADNVRTWYSRLTKKGSTGTDGTGTAD